MKLRILTCYIDECDVTEEIVDVSDKGDIIDKVNEYISSQEDEVVDIRPRVESREWFGGEWELRNENKLVFMSDVYFLVYSVVD